jgi:hypothetical protein
VHTSQCEIGIDQSHSSASKSDQDQAKLTDEDSRIMKVAGGGFDQCYNAQA